jgi:hypothetical protein
MAPEVWAGNTWLRTGSLIKKIGPGKVSVSLSGEKPMNRDRYF